jgi:hypothetical protein
VLSDATRSGGQYQVSFSDSTLPEGKYTEVRATWYPVGLEIQATHDVNFRVLGTYRHCRYNSPHESNCWGGPAERDISYDDTFCTAIVRNLRYIFTLELDEHGSGIADESGFGPLQVSARCQAVSHYTMVTQIRGAAGQPVSNSTVAVKASHPYLSWQQLSQVKIVGAQPSIKTVNDACPGCATTQLDNYTTNGSCSGISDLGNYRTIQIR